MAKYVEYTPSVVSQPDGPTSVFWFPTTFSQSQLGDRIIGSNACTLIAVLLAGRLNEFKITIWGYQDQPLSRMLVTSLAEAIVEGNEIHERLMETQGSSANVDLTVPEALAATAHKYPFLVEWADKTTLSTTPLSGSSLSANLVAPIIAFEQNPPADKRPNSSLYAVLVTEGRSVLWVYQPETSKVTVIDSHAHSQCLSGAVVAQARLCDIDNLCGWFARLMEVGRGSGGARDNSSSLFQYYEVAWIYVRE